MSTSHNLRTRLTSAGLVLVGNVLYALTVKLFLLPGGLVTGGTNGIAMTVGLFWDIPLSWFILLFNVIMMLVGLMILGRSFVVTTIASSLLYPLLLEGLNLLLGDVVLTNDILLNTIFCGFGIGISLGLVIRGGASTGGMDIPPLVLQKLFRIPVSISLYAFDFCILLTQLFFRPVENVLYGIVLLMIYTTVLDKMLLLGRSRTEVKIVSEKYAEICQAILRDVDRGVTLLNGEGGYLHTQKQIILSVISNRELVKLEKLIREIDPECFMIVSRVSEVRGRGFSLNRDYRAV